MDTVRTRTAAEYRAEMKRCSLIGDTRKSPSASRALSSPASSPRSRGALAECAHHYTGKKPVIVSPDIRTGLTMGVPDHAVGKDRLVDAAAANFPLPVVTVDLGTATTFNDR